MIVTTCTFCPKALGKQTRFIILLPESCEPPFRTLYLLHGLSDNEEMWLRRSMVELYAEKRGLAVVMPDGERSFYTNMVSGGQFFTYIADELVAVTRKMFPLSTKRADTFIAGLSMGGYGALKIALQRPDVFAAAASFSGAVDIAASMQRRTIPLPEFAAIWGPNATLAGSDDDLFTLAERVNALAQKPRIYQECGTEDFLYEDNVRFRDKMRALQFDYHYEERSGAHEWPFWNVCLLKAMDFFLNG